MDSWGGIRNGNVQIYWFPCGQTLKFQTLKQLGWSIGSNFLEDNHQSNVYTCATVRIDFSEMKPQFSWVGEFPLLDLFAIRLWLQTVC